MKNPLRKLFTREYKFKLSNGLPLTVRAFSHRQAIKFALHIEQEIYKAKQYEKEAERHRKILEALNLSGGGMVELTENVLSGMSA
jgi:hypothetical protein